MHHYVVFWQIGSQIFAVLNVVITAIEERCNQSGYAIYKH